MIHWNEKTTSEKAMVDLESSLTSNSFTSLSVRFHKLPRFLKNHIDLSIFKKKCERYPKKIEFYTSNLSCFKVLKEAGFEIILDSAVEKNHFKQKPADSSLKETKGVIEAPQALVRKISVPKTLIETTNVNNPLENEKSKYANDNIPETGIEKNQTTESSKESSKERDVEVLQPVSTTDEPVKISVLPKIRLEVTDNKKPAIITVKISKISIPKNSSQKELSLNNIPTNSGHIAKKPKSDNFSKIAQKLVEISESSDVIGGKSESVLTSESSGVLLGAGAAKSSIFKAKDLYKPRGYKKFITRAGLALGCLALFGFTAISYIPSYAYSVELFPDTVDKVELVKINTDSMASKDVLLSVHLEKSIPKEKKENLPKAQGTVVLYSKGSNSCNITNGGFFVGLGDKLYKVLANSNYYTTVNIPAYSSDSSNLVFSIEALKEGPDYNLEKGQLLNLTSLEGVNLSKNCFAKTLSNIANYSYVTNEEVNNDGVNELKEMSIRALDIREREEMAKISALGDNVEKSLTVRFEPEDTINSKIGDTVDVVAISRKQKNQIKFVSNNRFYQEIDKGIESGKTARNLVILGSNCSIGVCEYKVSYKLVSKDVDQERVKKILETVLDEKLAEEQIKKEFPQVKDVKNKKEGINIVNLKKVKVE